MKTVYVMLLVAVCMTGCTWKDAASITAGSLAAVAVAAAGGDPMDVGIMENAIGDSVTAVTDVVIENDNQD